MTPDDTTRVLRRLAAASARRILNGRDLTGWQENGRQLWTVEDGAATGRFDPTRPGPGCLQSDREYPDSDFKPGVLDFETRQQPLLTAEVPAGPCHIPLARFTGSNQEYQLLRGTVTVQPAAD